MRHFNMKHSGNCGDVIWAVPTVRALSSEQDASASLFLMTNVLADYYKGATHPCGKFRMTERVANALTPLLKAQPYLKDVKVWEKEPIDVDLDLFRNTGVKMDRGNIGRWYGYAFDVQLDLGKPWLFVEPDNSFNGKLVIARSQRYHGEKLWYKDLEKYKPIFVGLPEEYAEFSQLCQCTYVETKDFLELARIIAGCKAFVGNQSCPFAIAEGLKVPRALEVCPWAQNVIPEGDNCYDFISFLAQGRIVQRLMGW